MWLGPNTLKRSINVIRIGNFFYGRWVSPFHRPHRPLGRVEVQLYSIFDLGTRMG